MKNSLFLLIPVFFIQVNLMAQQLATPSDIQYQWHEQERIMFVCLDPCTWQGREYDDHSTPLARINPTKLDTDQWCETAQLWGAKEILFVAKHTGGFCWWQTETTDYGIKDTPYKNGKGDVLKELSESCRKYGLNLGIYVYPGDDTWGAGIGSGGKTSDPAKQEAYNEVFRTQLTEVLSNYGEAIEVWFDGSCVIDVSDILEKYASNSVIFQGPHATLRWPGTESGKLFYPVWNAVRKEDMATGVSTQVHGDPNGDVWAPLETNTTLYDHYWFWSSQKAKKRKSLDHIMECYYKSVGYGSVFLLNSTPDTTGLIPEDDAAFYRALGQEIDRRFKIPVQETGQASGETIIMELPEERIINHAVVMEDYRQGQRVREYTIDGFVNGAWIELCQGQSIGRKKIDFFEQVGASKLRLRIKRSVGQPLIRNFSAYFVDDFVAPPKESVSPWSAWQELLHWELRNNQKKKFEIDLTGRIKLPGQYTVMVVPADADTKVKIADAKMLYDGHQTMEKFVSIKGGSININRTAQVTDESRIKIVLDLESKSDCSGVVNFKPALIY